MADYQAAEAMREAAAAALEARAWQTLGEHLPGYKPDTFDAGYRAGLADGAVIIRALPFPTAPAALPDARDKRIAELEAALSKISRTPGMPFPDAGAHSWEAFGKRVYRAWAEIQRIARTTLSGSAGGDAATGGTER